MGKKRTVITYGTYFEDFLKQQSPKVQWKILQILRIVEEIEKAVKLMADYFKEKNT